MASNQAAASKLHSHATLLWIVTPALLILAEGLLTWRLWLADPSLSAENHLLENLQVLYLLLAAGLNFKRRFRQTAPDLRIYHSTLALLCFSMVLREIDFWRIGPGAIWLKLEFGIRALTALAWLTVVYAALKNLSRLWFLRWEILLAPKSLVTYLGIVLYMCSWFFDKNHIRVETHLSEFLEQSLQLGGTVYFLTSALMPLSFPSLQEEIPS